MLESRKNLKTNVLYLLGNGFDIFHGLPTRYIDFHKYIQVEYSDLENKLEDNFRFNSDCDYYWTDFEEDLSTFNWRAFFNGCNNINPLDEDFRPSFVYSLEDTVSEEIDDLISEIRDAFSNWICSIDINGAHKILNFEKDSFFINFNYTYTLENVYRVNPNRILHIHGDANENADDLIFGHNIILAEEPELDENGNSNRTLFSDAEANAKALLINFKKPVQETIKKYSQTFDNISGVKTVYILGHSLNSIDIPYTKEIFKKTSNVIWHVSYYQEKEITTFKSSLKEIGVPLKRLNFFKLSEGMP